MNNQLLVSQLWEEHERAPFPPGLRGEETSGVDLVMLDAETAGLIESIGRTGRLNSEQRSIAETIVRDPKVVLPALGGDGRAYLGRLLRALRAIG